jgi:hypothetical protein
MNPLIQFKTTTVLFVSVLVLGCFVCLPQMEAAPDEGPSLPEGFSGTNTFDGFHALSHQTSNTFNSAFGWASLLTQTTATGVTGCGAATLLLNTADNNTAVGAAALLLNTIGEDNTAVGFQALQLNVSAVTNVAVGVFAAQNNDSSGTGAAEFNVAVGGFALQANVNGTRNTAVGAGAMEHASGGNDNTAVGELAGNNITGSSNIDIGSGVQGVGGENNTIRIGDNLPTGTGASACFIGGILSHFIPPNPGNSIVTIDPVTQQLGMTTDFAAAKIEEQQKKIEEQQASIAELKSTVAQQQKGMEVLVAQLKDQAAEIQKVSAQFEVSKPAPQTVLNNQ